MIDSGYVIIALLITLCLLAALDLWRQIAIKDETQFEEHYHHGIQMNSFFWKFGYHLEDLEIKIDSQLERFSKIYHEINMKLAPRFLLTKTTLRNQQTIHHVEYVRKSRIILHTLEQNDTEIYAIRCEKDGPQIRIGLNDYRTDNRDECQLFTSPKVQEHIGPQYMFDLIHLESNGAFALRYVGNGMYVMAVPPPMDNPRLPWKLVIGGPSIGAAETFRLTSEGYLYSALMGGFFSCGSGQMISGYSDRYRSTSNRFILESVPKDLIMTSYALVDLSKKVSQIQTNYLQKYESQRSIRLTSSVSSMNSSSIYRNDADSPITIALAIPMTSKGTDMKDVLDSPFWNNLFDSFMKSIDWRSNKYIYRFYIGFDRADTKYDTGDSWSEFREEFKHRATFRLSEQMMTEEAINQLFDQNVLSLKLMHFDHLEGAPSQIVSQLVVTAYADKFDYFYQVNDDTILESPNWPPKLIATLKSNPFIPNFGVTGPVDSNNEKIFTHSFIHRTHIDVFGYLFPPVFKNWWSDDWISTVYGAKHTFRCPDVTIKHNVHGQKTGDINRYQVDKSAQFVLEDELRYGHAKIDSWLKKHSLPRLPLPEICGYIPTVRYIASKIIDNRLGNEIKESL